VTHLSSVILTETDLAAPGPIIKRWTSALGHGRTREQAGEAKGNYKACLMLSQLSYSVRLC